MEVLKNYDLGDWVIIVALIIYIVQTVFKIWVEQSIKKKYEVRSKAVLVADLMAEWVSKPEDLRKLRQLTNEAFLWLPSDLATELSKVLAHKKDALSYRELMNRVRKLLLGCCDTFESNRFITYDLTEYENAEKTRKKNEAAQYLSTQGANSEKENKSGE
ncbi:hypothetical protein ACE38U_09345 [Cedecea sp. S5-13]|uniref:hypothetical protein n=1 Tax=Cedecea selenatireducens TaxID=3144416 RepID=UPI0035CD1A27